MCERRVFDLLSLQQPGVELPLFPLLPTDPQANTHPNHSIYSVSLAVSELPFMLEASKEKCLPSQSGSEKDGESRVLVVN